MPQFLPYDPGPLPRRPAPAIGETIILRLDGLPPSKRRGSSLRNSKHPRRGSFTNLRDAAVLAMDGRAWFFGSVGLDLTIYAPSLMNTNRLIEYLGGVMDTLGGSSGFTFTYLPIIYEDDRQVRGSNTKQVHSPDERYEVKLTFLREEEASKRVSTI